MISFEREFLNFRNIIMGLCFYNSAYVERLDIAARVNDFLVHKIAAAI